MHRYSINSLDIPENMLKLSINGLRRLSEPGFPFLFRCHLFFSKKSNQRLVPFINTLDYSLGTLTTNDYNLKILNRIT